MDYSRDERQPYVAWRGQLVVRRRDKASGEICASGSSLKLPAYVGTWDSTSRSPKARSDMMWTDRSDSPSTGRGHADRIWLTSLGPPNHTHDPPETPSKDANGIND